MKPLKLSVQAFGPFAHKEEINFQELGESPLFLINGPTGAGKSSILDAICFALYGKTTGDERTPDQMRCDFADITLLTEVNLEFSVANKCYRIKRVPLQERAKSKGEGVTIQNSQANLWLLDGSDTGQLVVSSKVTDADNHIKQLLGLDVEQFRQVMVLPQGKFRDFLLADSKKREEIFSQLFQTSIYKKIEDGLKRKAAHIAEQMKERVNTIKGYLESAGVNSVNELVLELSELKPKLSVAEDEKQKAETSKQTAQKALDTAIETNNKFAIFESKKKEYDTHLSDSDHIEAEKQKLLNAVNAEKINPVYEQYQLSQAKKTSAENQLQQANEYVIQAEEKHKQSIQKLSAASDEYKQIESLKTQIIELQQNLNVAKEVLVAKQSFDQTKNQYLDKKKLLDQTSSKKDRALHEIKNNERLVEQLSEQTSNITKETIKLNELTNILQKRNELASIENKLGNCRQSLLDAEKAYEKSKNELEIADKSAKNKEMTWHLNQAAELANELSEGVPCPVCGSLEHPNKAQHIDTGNIFTKADVDAARDLVQTKREKEQFNKTLLNNVKNDCQQHQSTFDKLYVELGEFAVQSLEVTSKIVAEQKNVIKQLESNNEKIEQAKSEIKKLKEQVSKFDKEYAQLSDEVNHLNSQTVRSQTIHSELVKRLSDNLHDVSQIQALIEDTTDKIKSLTRNLEIATANEKQSHLALVHVKEQLNSKKQQLAQAEIEARSQSEKWQSVLKLSAFESENEFKKALSDSNNILQIQKKIETFDHTTQQLKGAINQLASELAKQQKLDIAELEQKLILVNAEFLEKENVVNELQQHYKSLQKSQKLLIKAKKENAKLDKEFSITGTLADVATGKSGNRLSLQRFVLSVLLDDVLIQASQRLKKMSKGRYQLIRKHDRAKGNKASGLELLVDDTYTGKARPVATLSGGESFMAALSLALGLSDIVQSYSGGIKLDTLFIDEGFGTLDPESLELSINTLIDLQAAGRTIGVISHVSELKSQMALRIDITADKDGSRIRTVGI